MKATIGLGKAIRVGTITVGLILLANNPTQAAEGKLPAMFIINQMQPLAISRQSVESPAGPIPVAPLPTPVVTVEPSPPLNIIAEAAQGYIVFADNAKHLDPNAGSWPPAKLQAMMELYDEAILDIYAAEGGFGDIEG